MIWRKNKYKFDTETLRFVEDKKSRVRRLAKALSVLTIINALALSIFFILNSFVDSPTSKIQKNNYVDFNNQYRILSYKLDSLTIQLHSNNFINDQIYRSILELDSLSYQLRIAGAGGSDPYKLSLQTEPSELIEIRSKIAHLKRQIIIQQESYDEILTSAVRKNRQVQHFPGISPIKMTEHIRISSYFGNRSDPFTHFKKSHSGVDFVGPKNTEIFATADGIVTLTQHSRKGYGNEILIDHQFGHETRYAHLNKIVVKEGQKVERGQLIGYMGNTGRSTGTHLHYEVRYHKRPVNPLYFFADDLTPDEYEQLAKRAE
ncbi:MAG: M23 family metallopeptidase [Bacteroidales bacterium]|nr:M23 family metallopeptidase [Bacteroidales bacterium]